MGYLDVLIERTLESYEAKDRQADYFSNPVAWARDYLGIQLWSAQAEVAMSVVDNHNTVVKAGHEVGKSFLAGVLIAWWVDTRWQLPGGCFVVSTAPSTKQINAIVWREVRKFYQLARERYDKKLIDHPLPGYITSDAHWRLPNGIELGYGAKPPEHKEDTMSGIHARYVLAVGDEAVGLTSGLIEDLGNITSNGTSRVFLICNPTNPLSYVATIFKEDFTNWSKHTISVFDSPNFHGGEGMRVEVLETLVDQSYVDGKLAEWGGAYEDEMGRMLSKHPKFMARVMGEFAWDQGFTLIPPEDMAVGLDTDIIPSTETLPVLGVDVSRSEHGDMNTIYINHDGKIRLYDAFNERNAIRTAERINQAALATGAYEVRIDGVGLGGPICDYVAELCNDRYWVREMLGGNPSPDRVRWFNSRAWWYATFAEKLRDGKLDIDETDEQLQEELLGIEIKKRAAGLDSLLLESKEDMRKRGVGSPDYADAAIYAAAEIGDVGDPAPGAVVQYDLDSVAEQNHGFYASPFGW